MFRRSSPTLCSTTSVSVSINRCRISAAAKAGTKDPNAEAMQGAFKTPTLRSITLTAPYFHDGRAKTLDEAVDFMLKGGIKNPHLDEKLKPRTISKEERGQLMAFLKSLTPESKPFEKPQVP